MKGPKRDQDKILFDEDRFTVFNGWRTVEMKDKCINLYECLRKSFTVLCDSSQYRNKMPVNLVREKAAAVCAFEILQMHKQTRPWFCIGQK